MNIFHRKVKVELSDSAQETIIQAATELSRQKEQHEKEQELRERLAQALQKNHLAQLMYEALDQRR